MSRKEELVFSGMSGRFPESENIDVLWNNLIGGVDMVNSENPRWPVDYFDLPPRTGKLKNLPGFDAEFFGINRHQAMDTSPQVRMIQEVVYEAICDAGKFS